MTRLLDRLIRRDGYWEGMSSGAAVLTTSYGGPDREAILPQITAWAQSAYSNTSVVFAAMVVRILVFSEAELVLQAKDDKHLFTNQSLSLLQEPFGPDSGTSELLARMELDGGIAGNSYLWQPPDENLLVRLRPDWVTIVSELVPVSGGGWYRRKVGYWFEPPKGVVKQGNGFLVPAHEVAHYAPLPDPAASFRGMSWLTPVMRDIQGEDGMARYKIRYLTNNATPNMVLKYAQKLQQGTVDAIRERVNARYGGPDNAGRTLVLDQGADLLLAGNSLQQMDFAAVQQAGSDRILAASGVPGVLVGLEPLRGAGKGYQESIQKFANMWARPSWRRACKVLEKFVPGLLGGTRLWYDTSDIAMLADGELERGQASLVRAQAMLALVQAGYTHESAVAAVNSSDITQLQAGGLGTPAGSQPVQHLLGQQQPGVTATPLPPTLGRLPTGPVSGGDGGDNTRPLPRQPASARRGLNGDEHA